MGLHRKDAPLELEDAEFTEAELAFIIMTVRACWHIYASVQSVALRLSPPTLHHPYRLHKWRRNQFSPPCTPWACT